MKNKHSKIFNPKSTKAQRQHLRNNMTNAEIKLWSVLKGRKVLDMKFRRQHGIGNYIVDFYCPELKFVIEVDGDTHYYDAEVVRDKKRTIFLNELGIEVIRFSNKQIFEQFDGILLEIENKISKLKNK